MTTKFFFLGAAVAMAAGLSACGAGDVQPSVDVSPETKHDAGYIFVADSDAPEDGGEGAYQLVLVAESADPCAALLNYRCAISKATDDPRCAGPHRRLAPQVHFVMPATHPGAVQAGIYAPADTPYVVDPIPQGAVGRLGATEWFEEDGRLYGLHGQPGTQLHLDSAPSQQTFGTLQGEYYLKFFGEVGRRARFTAQHCPEVDS